MASWRICRHLGVLSISVSSATLVPLSTSAQCFPGVSMGCPQGPVVSPTNPAALIDSRPDGLNQNDVVSDLFEMRMQELRQQSTNILQTMSDPSDLSHSLQAETTRSVGLWRADDVTVRAEQPGLICTLSERTAIAETCF